MELSKILDYSESLLSTARFNILSSLNFKEIEDPIVSRNLCSEVEELSQECYEVPADEEEN